jgi:hypothetical protein
MQSERDDTAPSLSVSVPAQATKALKESKINICLVTIFKIHNFLSIAAPGCGLSGSPYPN